ncbi:uncharacterized protein LOC127789557 isoform X2 [Diospyros lotus]|uniref:uncharacterized protein LOC127789557 isoform X2 n=1 Tax=Diospyros lotus TaxID=55363 RepID=UPI00224E187F|nr:uncharacterized protein LOC127789557 isoform X2 [Diospyros lotus]
MGQKKGFLLLLLLLLVLAASCLLLSSAVAAVPSSEILKPFKDDPSVDSVHRLLPPQGKMETGTGEKPTDEEGVLMIERRMDLETTDYEGTGANDDHDPKSPAQV